jgi:hypothetical protein
VGLSAEREQQLLSAWQGREPAETAPRGR